MEETSVAEELETFDRLPLDTQTARRAALQPLYDYYERALEEVGMELLQIDGSRIEPYHVHDQWKIVVDRLRFVDIDTGDWSELPYRLGEARKNVQHRKQGVSVETLTLLREKAEAFRDWLEGAGAEYYRQSKDFTLKEAYYHHAQEVLQRLEIEEKFDRGIPYAAKLGRDTGILEAADSYRNQIRQRLGDIAELDDLTAEDLLLLMQIQGAASRLEGRKEALLKEELCPVCGGAIVESQTSHGAGPDGGTIIYSIGCEECEYNLHSEGFAV